MKKYIPLILFFCFGYSIQFNAQPFSPGLLPIDGSGGLLQLDFFGPVNNIIDLHSVSNYHFFNPYLYNPAMAGIEDKRKLNFDWNRQFNHSANMSFEQPLANINSAIGVQYEYSVKDFGKIHRYGLAYNYEFRGKGNSQLRLGVQFSQINIKVDEYYFIPLEKDKWYSFPSLDVGMVYQHKKLRVGVSVQNLAPKKYARISEVNETYVNEVATERTLNISVANTFKLSKKWDWSLACLLRFNNYDNIEDYYYYYEKGSSRKQHDLSTYLSLHKKYMIGLTYRSQHNPVWIGFVGVKLKEKLNLQFSFNMGKEEYEPKFWEGLVQYEF